MESWAIKTLKKVLENLNFLKDSKTVQIFIFKFFEFF